MAKKKSLNYGHAVAVLIPFLLVILGYRADLSYPRNDEAYYLESSQDMYFALKSHGFWNFLYQGYMFRPKPILHPAIGGFFFALTGGNPLLASALCVSFFYLLFAFFTCRILSRYLEGARLVLATAVMGSIPWVLQNAFGFNSEIALLSCVAPALYYFLVSDFFRDKRASLLFGVWLALAMCMRPIETMVSFGPPVVIAIFSSFKKRTIHREDVLTCFVTGGLTLAAFIWQVRNRQGVDAKDNLVFLTLMVLPAAVLAIRKRLRLTVAFTGFVVSFFAIIIFWYAPFITAIYDWAWRATFGDFTKITGGGFNDHATLLFHLIARIANLSFLFLVLIMPFRLFSGEWKKSAREMKPSQALLIVASLIAIPFLLGSVTYNGLDRYYYASGFVAYLVALIWILKPAGAFQKTRFALVLCLAVAHFTFSLSENVEAHFLPWSWKEWMGNPDPRPQVADGNAILRLHETFKKLLPKEGAQEVCLLQMRQMTDLDWVADPPALNVIGRQEGLKWHFIRPWPFRFPELQKRYEYVRDTCDYFVVLPLEWKPSRVEHFMSDVGELVLKKWHENRLGSEGMHVVGQAEYESGNHDRGKLVVIKIQHKNVK